MSKDRDQELADLRAEVERLREDVAEYDGILSRQGDLLTRTVNVLRGDPPELTTWSHHDVPELAAGLHARAEAAEAEVERLRRELAEETEAHRADLLADIEEGLDASDALIEALSRAEAAEVTAVATSLSERDRALTACNNDLNRALDLLRAAEARLRAVEALADQWDREADRYDGYSTGSSISAELEQIAKNLRSDATALRAVLQGSAKVDQDLAEAPSGGVAPTEQAGEAKCAGVCVVGPMSAALCDDDGWVRSGMWHWGTDYKCTGSVHPPLDSPIWPGHEIRCANPIHDVKLPAVSPGTVTVEPTATPTAEAGE